MKYFAYKTENSPFFTLACQHFLLYEIISVRTNCFRKDTSMLTNDWSDNMEDPDAILIKLSGTWQDLKLHNAYDYQ